MRTKLAERLGKLPQLPKYLRFLMLVLAHAVFFSLAYVGAFLVRFDFQPDARYFDIIQETIIGVVAVKLMVFAGLKMFHGWWKYLSLYDLIALARNLLVATGFFIALNVFVITPNLFPRSIYFLDYVLSLILIGGARGSLRLFREFIANGPVLIKATTNLLIVGAGDTGETLLREITKNRNLPYKPIAFLDDADYKHGLRIHGVPVLGPVSAMPEFVAKYDIGQVIIAMPSATREQLRRIVEIANHAQVDTKILPAVEAILDGNISVNQLREVSINDLLGREPVRLDTHSIARFIERRTVLITGAGGSIGSELCRQVLRFNPQNVVLVDSAETPLFFIHRELREKYADKITPYVANVTERARMDAIFKYHRPDVVIHAAAYKHVPLMEQNPCEAVKNNIGGTRTVADIAAKYDVNTFVLISTDKAVNPTSIMGATKRVTEYYIQGLNKICPQTKFCAVRFGNVLGSNGSVIPIFREQIKKGGPVTVTHPEMTRYFMTIPEAVQLVLQAAAFKSGGELFILDMGEPVKIAELARDMIRLSGASEKDIPIVYSGVRPGEKLYEELTLEGENVDQTSHKKIFVGQSSTDDFEGIRPQFETLLKVANAGKEPEVRRLLHALIPTYFHPEIPDNVVSIDKSREQAEVSY